MQRIARCGEQREGQQHRQRNGNAHFGSPSAAARGATAKQQEWPDGYGGQHPDPMFTPIDVTTARSPCDDNGGACTDNRTASFSSSAAATAQVVPVE